jgi:hypothetical protein
MKIIVTPTGKKANKKVFVVTVLDGLVPIHSESVHGVGERDKLVWKLADLYGAIDIEIQETEREDEFKYSEIPSIPVLEESEAEEFFETNKEIVFGRIVKAVEEGVKMQLKTIRVFELNGTGVYITSKVDDWKSGVEEALEYYVSTEQYKKCIKVKQLLSKL